MTKLECMGCAVEFDAPQGAPCPECGTARDVWALDETVGA